MSTSPFVAYFIRCHIPIPKKAKKITPRMPKATHGCGEAKILNRARHDEYAVVHFLSSRAKSRDLLPHPEPPMLLSKMILSKSKNPHFSPIFRPKPRFFTIFRPFFAFSVKISRFSSQNSLFYCSLVTVYWALPPSPHSLPKKMAKK